MRGATLIDELDWVRWRLEQLVEQRFLAPLPPRDTALFARLSERERELLAHAGPHLVGAG
jgi:hypothetical protein